MSIFPFLKLRYMLWSGMLAAILISLTVTGYQGEVITDSVAEESSEPSVRRIEIVIESMKFMNNNPTFRVRPGETVEFRVLNMDPGMIHDMSIPDLKVKTRPLKEGEEALLLVTFPMRRSSGSYVYLCTFHPISMRGRITVDNGDGEPETWGQLQ